MSHGSLVYFKQDRERSVVFVRTDRIADIHPSSLALFHDGLSILKDFCGRNESFRCPSISDNDSSNASTPIQSWCIDIRQLGAPATRDSRIVSSRPNCLYTIRSRSMTASQTPC